MRPMTLGHTAGEQRRQQLVLLDPVVEGVDQPPEGSLPAGPLEQRRHSVIWHDLTLGGRTDASVRENGDRRPYDGRHVRRPARLLRRHRPARVAARPSRDASPATAADGTLLAAGPWSDDSGALLVFAVDTRDEIDAILADDPYYAAPGVEITSVQEWNPVTRHQALDGL